jgi:hypothetical protein
VVDDHFNSCPITPCVCDYIQDEVDYVIVKMDMKRSECVQNAFDEGMEEALSIIEKSGNFSQKDLEKIRELFQ